jgi:formylglycine-generating enzyme required for sulfatase activity
MKTRFSKSLRVLFTIAAALGLVIPSVRAQTSLGLSVQMYAGLSLTGAVGTVCQVQYVTDPGATWLPLTNLTLVSNPQLWVDTACPATARRFYRAVTAAVTVPTNMVLIPAGSFTMGNCMDPGEGYSDELPLHTVYVSAFCMDKYAVTKDLWDAVKTWSGGNGYQYDKAGSGKAGTHPVQMINWYDAVKWCNARSQMEGLTPCYYTDAGTTVLYKTGDKDNVYVNWGANGYRLPTEAEWEKAARGGADGHRFPWSDSNTITQGQADYYSDAGQAYDTNPTPGFDPAFNDGVYPYTSPAGSFAPNGYGLYDMAGNVYQWCWDWYGGTYYSSSPASDPRGADNPSGNPYVNRMARGGAWGANAKSCRTSQRFNDAPFDAFNGLGFRVVRVIGQ